MPAERKEQIGRLPSGKWQLRYFDKGVRHSGGAFPSKSSARAHYRNEIEPGLNGKPVARRDLTYSELVAVFLERHAIVAKPRTITELRWRLKQSAAKFGTVPLVELEGMADEIAGFAVGLSERLRYPIMASFRQALEAGVRYKADEGTRTLDLLHGNASTLTTGAAVCRLNAIVEPIARERLFSRGSR